jgi:hypothetical protein
MSAASSGFVVALPAGRGSVFVQSYYIRCMLGAARIPEGVRAMSRKHMGSSIDDFLKKEGIFDEAQAQAVKEVVAWQLAAQDQPHSS